MTDDASQRSLERELSELRAIVERLAREDRIGEILATASQPPGPRHARPKRDRHGLYGIRGGLAAFVPLLLPGHPPAAMVVPAAARAWFGRRAWPRWALAALALGVAGATVPVAASDGVPPARQAPALSCPEPAARYPDRGDGRSDSKTVVAPLPVMCPAAGEGSASPLTGNHG